MRTSRSRRRSFARGEFDAAMRDLRNERAVPADRSEFTRRHIEKALARAGKKTEGRSND
jgi:hypothetical protein